MLLLGVLVIRGIKLFLNDLSCGGYCSGLDSGLHGLRVLS